MEKSQICTLDFPKCLQVTQWQEPPGDTVKPVLERCATFQTCEEKISVLPLPVKKGGRGRCDQTAA